MGSKKGQMFIVSVVFLIGVIFVVQQALFNYSAVDMSSSFNTHDSYVFYNVLSVINQTLVQSYYCNDTKDGFRWRMEQLKASYLEEFGREYSIGILYTLDCARWDNPPPGQAPLALTLSVSGQGRDMRGAFQLYHKQ